MTDIKQIFRILSFSAISCCILLSGCASSRSDEIARLLKEIETEDILAWNTDKRPAQTPGVKHYDSPDSADAGLPPVNTKRSEPAKTTFSNYRPADLEITIQPGCLVQVSVKEDPELDGNYEVNTIGAITLGYIGPIILLNKNANMAAEKITEVLTRRNFRMATVSVKIARASYDRVYVGGDVNNPGEITIGAGDTISLNNALLRAGGIKASIKGAMIKIVNGGLTNAMAYVAKGTIYSLASENGDAAVPGIQLKNNDVAIVLSTESKVATGGGEKEITVLGEVKRPGVFKFADNETCSMMHLMFKIGELPIYANKKEVKIFRKDEHGIEEEIVVDIEKIMDEGRIESDVALEHNDRVLIPRLGLRWF